MMRRLLVLLFSVAFLAAGIGAADAVDMKVKGVFKTWALSQNQFRAGKDDIKDNYVVSLVRLAPTFSAFNGDVKVHLRFDMAQGWWGVNNQRGTFLNWQGDNRTSSTLFADKGTNYPVHVDVAYINFKLPFTDATRIHLGRSYWKVGNKLVLDYEYDGVKLIQPLGDNKLTLGWAKINEGYMGLSDRNAGKILWDAGTQSGVDGGDANMLMAMFDAKVGGDLSAWFIWYKDSGIDDDTAYLNDQIDYSMARFKPQVTQLNILGANWKGKVGPIALNAEFDYLWGKDDIANTSYDSSGIPDGTKDGNTRRECGNFGSTSGTASTSGYLPPHCINRLDKNNGDLSGWTLMVKADWKEIAPSLNLGLLLGAGSGDSDVRSGKGNVNKLETEGWLYVSEVWEDSIMPDITGITPQGLGSPWSRGYREFENQWLAQLNATYKITSKVKLYVAAQYMQAMEEIPSWAGTAAGPTANVCTGGNCNNDGNGGGATVNGNNKSGGPNYSNASKDLGYEVDAKLSYAIQPGLVFDLRGGYMWIGEGAANLIAGNPAWDKNPWEARWDVTWKF
ncbi:MAG TPA: hypothetical protein ENJ37_05680 [Deltaproteobacteria bacterium]|nr:hypothetical protein [Deltaproteobacteria bacterium]